MKYKIIGENNYNSNDIREEILKNRGIKNINKFINLDNSVITNPKEFKNMDKAVQCLLKHVENGSNIYIYEDADPDGLTSFALLYNYSKEVFSNINLNFVVHDKRIHGIKMNEIKKELYKMDLLIVLDGGSDNFKEHKWLKKLGIDVIIIDHHDVKHESKNAIVVNNQLSKISQNLCGVAMAYKFCKAIDEELWEDKADKYIDLVALGLISDMMNLSNLEVQYYVREGINRIKNNGFKELLDIQSYDMKNIINPQSIAFYITPMINAVFRLGTKDDYIMLSKSFANIDADKIFIYEPKRGKNKGEKIEESIYQHVARRCKSLNDKRKRLSKKMIEELDGEVNINNKILVIDIGQEFGEKGMARLVANGFQRKYNKPTIAYYLAKDKKYKGSMASNTGDFMDRLNSTDLFEFVAGHQNASGLEIKKDKIKNVARELEEEFKDEVFEKVYDVDFVVPFDEFNEIGGDIIQDVCTLNDYFGKEFESPYILIKNICIDVKEVENIGKTKNTIKIKTDEVSFVKFKSNEQEYSELVDWKDTVQLNILGRCAINEYEGGIYPQIIIEEWEVIESENEDGINNSENTEIEKNVETDGWEW